jgi:dihydrofolate reductase
MRKIRYKVAISLDGYIAGPNEEYDWIGTDPEIDFATIWAQFDTLLMGRRTYELAVKHRGKDAFAGMNTFVFSRTLKEQDHPKVTILSEVSESWVRALRAKSGKDIWLFGGGSLFRPFLDAGQVDSIEVAVIPVLLGAGIPLMPPPYTPTKLQLLDHKLYRSGRMSLTYAVQKD